MNIVGRVVLSGLVLILTSCQPKSPLTDVSGDLEVLIPLPNTRAESETDEAQSPNPSNSNYALKKATLKGVQSLKEVRGDYAQFVYSPGSAIDSLEGSAPQARFAKDKSNTFLPLDQISAQMAAIYFHLQNLIDLNQMLGLRQVTRMPFLVGVEVKKPNVENKFERNNAFYDGLSDSMLFLPNSSDALALYLNAGVIAHEFFHSIFYKKVLGSAVKTLSPSSDQPISEMSSADLFNLTYIRGVNEGLADFWGWIYTRDLNFMQQSFDSGTEARNLGLAPAEVGFYQFQESIRNQVRFAIQSGDRGDVILMDYIYFVGTPHARFLRQLVLLDEKAERAQATTPDQGLIRGSVLASGTQEKKNLSERLTASAKKWITFVLDFTDELNKANEALTKKKSANVLDSAQAELSAAKMFEYVYDQSKVTALLNLEQCELLIPYLQNASIQGRFQKQTTGETFKCKFDEGLRSYVVE